MAVNWSEWINYEQGGDSLVSATARYGVYRNRLVDERGKPIAIKHPGGTDKEGIMYIGAAGVRRTGNATPVRDRYTLHRRAHAAGKSGAGADKRLVRLWKKISAKHSGAIMQFQYRALGSAAEASAEEKKLLSAFRASYGVDPDDLWCAEHLHREPF